MEELIKKELFKNVESFLNELDLTMEYLDSQIIPSIRNYMKTIDSDKEEYTKFLEYTTQHLGTHESKISAILFSNKKVKSDYYNFLNGITLFSNILNFRVFENESKNTKKGLIKYVYSIYMSSILLHQIQSQETSQETSQEGNQDEADVLSHKLAEFVDKIQKEAETALKEEDIKVSKPSSSSKHKRRNAVSYGHSDLNHPDILSNLGNLANLGGGGGDLSNIMESLLGNKEILNIATDISQKMHSQQLNPMSMLSSLMSGDIENSPLQSLVEEIQQKVEDKINSGEINKDSLEDQAKNIMGTISNNSGALNSMPGMSSLINNMMKEMDK
jgi:hypothetical protein